MRLGLHGVAEEDGAGRSLASLVASLGAVTVSIRAAVGAAGPFPWDALLLSTPFGAGDDAQPMRTAIEAFARAGGPVLGIGGGFQSLCALGLLPGRVVARGAGVPAADSSHLRVEGRPTPFTSAIPAGRVLRSARAPSPLEYQIAEAEALQARGQVIFRYCDAAGGTTRPIESIAGVCDQTGNVVGLLADPEIAGGDGAQLLGSLRMHHLKARRA